MIDDSGVEDAVKTLIKPETAEDAADEEMQCVILPDTKIINVPNCDRAILIFDNAKDLQIAVKGNTNIDLKVTENVHKDCEPSECTICQKKVVVGKGASAVCDSCNVGVGKAYEKLSNKVEEELDSEIAVADKPNE